MLLLRTVASSAELSPSSKHQSVRTGARKSRVSRGELGSDNRTQKEFRRWLLRRRPVTEAVIRRNKNHDSTYQTSCKRSFKKILRIFSSCRSEGLEKTDVRACSRR